MQNKRLFVVRDTRTNQVLPEFFGDKRRAKARRDELNATAGSPVRYVVSVGPDHRRAKTAR